MNRRTLKQEFISIQFFVGILPISLASLVFGYLIYNVETRRKNMVEFQNRQIVSDIQRQLTFLENDAELFLRSSEVTDFLLAPDVMRPFLENRVYGRITEFVQKQSLQTYWMLVSKDYQELIRTGNLGNVSTVDLEQVLLRDTERAPYSSVNGFLILKKIVRLDDQQQSGPNARTVGVLFVAISTSDLESQFENKIFVGSFENHEQVDSIQITIKDSENGYISFFGMLGGIFLVTTLSVVYGIHRLKDLVVKPIEDLSNKVLHKAQSSPLEGEKNEIRILENAVDTLERNLHELHLQKLKSEKVLLLEQTARQVSHDIRSPLSALTLVVNTLDQVPEEKRLLLRNAANRINDIANTLLSKAKLTQQGDKETSASVKSTATTELIPVLVDMLISEKRVQYRNRMDIEISSDLNQSYGCFARIDQVEFKRALSNLINNSVEAIIDRHGKIVVRVNGTKNQVHIRVQDNGVGIQKDVLDRLGEMPVSFGKKESQSGSGIGVLHARRTIENIGGTLNIQSVPGQGTIVDLHLPRADSPSWFVEQLDMSKYSLVVVLDDDLSIHQVWKNRIQGVPILSFTSGSDFKIWCQTHAKDHVLFLVDFELLGQSENGLELIQKMDISHSSILVSSQYEDDAIKKESEKLQVRMITKG